MQTAVLIVGFNRPEAAAQVLNVVRSQQPQRLYLAVDGPRDQRPLEAEKVAAVRKLVESVDWPCQVKTRFSEKNQGCRLGVSSAITWFFEQEEEGIILEDDCVPHPSFFTYCQVMLERYRHDPRVGHVGGFNVQEGRVRGKASYYFSQYFHVWGWATWRRAWKDYDVTMASYPQFLAEKGLEKLFAHPALQKYWKRNFEAVLQNRLNTWDYQWVYTNWVQGRVGITPNVNLVQNIGFGEGATHTSQVEDSIVNIKSEAIRVDEGPLFVLPDREADEFTYTRHVKLVFAPGIWGFLIKAWRKVLRLLRGKS